MKTKLFMGVALSVVMTAGLAVTAHAETEESKKIAVIRNMTSSDHTAQFFKGCTEEGEALGYTVDTFMSNGDDVKMQDLMEQALNQDYDIWIISHANEGYQYDFVSRAVEAGIKVVGFDCGGDHVDGVTYTTQNDTDLTKISIDALIEKAIENGAEEPVNILEVNTLGAIVPFDTRHAAIQEYVDEGKLNVVQLISPNLAGDVYSDVYNGVSTALTNNPDGIDGVWTASTAFLDGICDALNASGREDIVATGIDISDTEIERLAVEPAYYCCAAVDPYVIGELDVRLAVMKVLGEETPEEVQFSATGVFKDDVAKGDSMASLGGKIEGFGSSDEFNTDGIQKLRAENE